jgi:uncharacterized protein YjbI with pentapeptide repeats
VKREKATLLEWLGVKRDIDFSEHSALGGFLGFLLGLFILSLVIISFAVLVMLVTTVFESGIIPSEKTAESIRNLGLLLAATVGLPFLVWRSIVAQKQVNVAEQGHITDRINEAVKGLGAEKIIKRIKRTPRYRKENGEWVFKDGKPLPALRPDGERIVDEESFEESAPNLEVRIGSIYALERIALDSPRDHIQIMEILCAYIRENLPAQDLNPMLRGELSIPKLRIDCQAVVSVVGRRSMKQIEFEARRKYRLDFRFANLSGGDFRKGDFSGAMFHDAKLEGADFGSCRLSGTQFHRALLNHANFLGARLEGTDFSYVTSTDPKPFFLGVANAYGVNLVGANFSTLANLAAKEVGSTFGSRDTVLSAHLDRQRSEFNSLVDSLETVADGCDTERVRALEEKISASEFKNWSTHEAYALETKLKYNDFMERHNLTGFPYSDD